MRVSLSRSRGFFDKTALCRLANLRTLVLAGNRVQQVPVCDFLHRGYANLRALIIDSNLDQQLAVCKFLHRGFAHGVTFAR